MKDRGTIVVHLVLILLNAEMILGLRLLHLLQGGETPEPLLLLPQRIPLIRLRLNLNKERVRSTSLVNASTPILIERRESLPLIRNLR